MTKHQAIQQHFPCESCGSDLEFEPGQQKLVCGHCGHSNAIDTDYGNIREYSFEQALHLMDKSKLRPLDNSQVIKCPNCSATFELDQAQHAGDCPFCGTPVVTETQQMRLFQPKSLLPFLITEKQAYEAFDRWLSSLWFAPSALKNKAQREDRILGIYVPYWTYDSHTDSHYRGERGTVYYEQRMVTVTMNGRSQRKMQRIRRIRWRPVSGHVRMFFDDILVGASKTLPRKILDRLQPWDLDRLVSYDEAFLSGFQSELYQVDLDAGFVQAQGIMNQRIREAIRRDIGGDEQRVHHVQTRHDDTTFKHLLLPVWSAAFRYNNKTYRFVINGRNGRTQGERPYSKIKIALAVLGIMTVIITGLYSMDQAGVFDQIMQMQSSPYGSDIFYLPRDTSPYYR